MIKELKEYKDSHDEPETPFEKGYIAGITACISQLEKIIDKD